MSPNTSSLPNEVVPTARVDARFVLVVEVVVGGESAAGLVGEPVVPAAGGERESALADAGPDAVGGVGAVAFERELALEGVVDRFDPLADAAECAEAPWFVAAVEADQMGAERVVR